MGNKTFVMYMAIPKHKVMLIHLENQAQIKVKANNRAQVRVLLFNEASTIVLMEYSNYNNLFLIKNIAKLLEYTRINEYAI